MLDKDIEILETLKDKKISINSMFYSTGIFELNIEEKQAIENVIKELKAERELSDELVKYMIKFCKGIFQTKIEDVREDFKERMEARKRKERENKND